MEHDGERMLNASLGLIGERREVEAHFLAHSVSDQAWQPNTVAEIMQFDGHLSTY